MRNGRHARAVAHGVDVFFADHVKRVVADHPAVAGNADDGRGAAHAGLSRSAARRTASSSAERALVVPLERASSWITNIVGGILASWRTSLSAIVVRMPCASTTSHCRSSSWPVSAKTSVMLPRAGPAVSRAVKLSMPVSFLTSHDPRIGRRDRCSRSTATAAAS